MKGWFLVHTKPRQESRALENLLQQGINAFYPQVFVEKLTRGRRKVTKEALFPSYLFVEFDQETISTQSVNFTRGVNRIVSFSNTPSRVPEKLIFQLKTLVDKNNENTISELPNKGEQIKILDGPFRGLNAIFSQIDGDSRAVVLITILSQKVKAVLPLQSLSRNASASSEVI